MAGASFLPDIIWDDPYFAEGKIRPLTRREAVLWIAKNVRRVDNCVVMKGEGDWSLRYLAEAWNWAKTTVERFLKRCEKLGILVTRKRKIGGTVQYVIKYVFSTLSAFSEKVTGTDSGTEAGHERDKEESRESEEVSGMAQQASPQPEFEDPFEDILAKKQEPETGAGPKTPRKKREAKIASEIPADWVPGADLRKWALSETIGASNDEIDFEVGAFKDKHKENGKKFKDIDAAFRTWMRNFKRWGGSKSKKTEYKSFKQRDYEREWVL